MKYAQKRGHMEKLRVGDLVRVVDLVEEFNVYLGVKKEREVKEIRKIIKIHDNSHSFPVETVHLRDIPKMGIHKGDTESYREWDLSKFTNKEIENIWLYDI